MNSNHEASFEYKPMQTEMNNDVTHSTINNKLSELSSEIENVLDESGSFLNSNMNSINLNSLQSLRISHSNLKDDATTLLDRMKGITNSNEEEEIEDIQQKPVQKIQFRKDIFDSKKGSSNKKINISQLDIKIGNNVNKEKKNQTHKVLNKRLVNLKPNLLNNHRNINLPSKSKLKQNNIISNERSLYKNTNNSIQKTAIKEEKKRPIYSSVKKISSKQSFFDIMQKLTVKGNRASSYKKSTNTNYTSNRSSSVTNKTINNPTSSTIDSNFKKRKSLIPSTGVKGKNPNPYISKFAYCATEQSQNKKTVQKRPTSQKKPTIVTIITNKQKKKIPLTTTHGNKKFNFNMNSYLQAIHSQYHTIATESKKKTTNSFFGSSSLHYSNVNTVYA